MVGPGMIENVLGRIGGKDHPIPMLGQHFPEAPDATGHVEDQAWLASDLERIAYQSLFTPERQTLDQALRPRLQTDAGVFLIVAPGELEFDGGWG
jgi:hypothetical protein